MTYLVLDKNKYLQMTVTIFNSNNMTIVSYNNHFATKIGFITGSGGSTADGVFAVKFMTVEKKKRFSSRSLCYYR